MLSVFNTMAEGILSTLGEDAFFDGGTVPIKVNIEHGVQLAGIGGEEAAYRGDHVANRDVATLLLRYNPITGKRFTFAPTASPSYAGRTFRLEALVEDNGVTRRYVILEIK